MHSPQNVESPLFTSPSVHPLGALRTWTRQASALERAAYLAAALLCAVYVFYFAQLTSVPFQDYPNHLARAGILADLLFEDGVRYGSAFGLNLAPMPYVLHDLLFAVLLQLFGPVAGTGIFTTIVLLSLPCALLFYMHATGVAPRARLVVFLLSLLLATDWFFLMAFMAFRLAIALTIVSLAIAELLRRRWSAASYVAYLGVLAVGYLTHLAGPVFFLVVIGVSAVCRLWLKTSTLTREAQLVLPVLAVLAFHYGVIEEPRTAEYPAVFQFYWGRWDEKLNGLWYQFTRFVGRSSKILALLIALCALLAVWRQLRPALLRSPMVIENALIAAAFVGVYFLLPREYADSSYVDVRALVMISLFVLITSLWLVHGTEGRGFDTHLVRGFAMLLVAVNLAHIAKRMSPADEWLSRYREVVGVVPAGSRVLPVSTRGKTGNFNMSLHAGSFLVLDRAALEPYLFSRNRGDVMKFFYYKDRPYMPQENWYRQQLKWRAGVTETYTVLGKDYTWRFEYSKRDQIWQPLALVPIDWARVACDYDLILVARPYDAFVIELPYSPVAENDAASLLAIDKQACKPQRARQVRLPSER